MLLVIVQEGAAAVKKVKGSYLFQVTASDGKKHEWLVDLKSGNGSVKKGTGQHTKTLVTDSTYIVYITLLMHDTSLGMKGECTIIMKDEDLMDLFAGKLAPQKV